MPIYEYHCSSCDLVQEKLVSHSEPEHEKMSKPCDQCAGPTEKVISLGNFELKGNWFKTKGTY